MVDPTTMFGPLDLLYPYVEFVLLGLVILNAVTRRLSHSRHVDQAEAEGAGAVERYAPHTASNALLLLGAFYYTTVSFQAGFLLTVMVIGVVVTDVFEFEARLVEARKEVPLEAPKGAMAAWTVAAIYVAYRSLFFVVQPLWDAVVG